MRTTSRDLVKAGQCSKIPGPPLIARVDELLDALRDDMTGHELRARRLALGLSQRGLAERLGIPWNTIARWERGELTIEHPRMLALALDALQLAQRRP